MTRIVQLRDGTVLRLAAQIHRTGDQIRLGLVATVAVPAPTPCAGSSPDLPGTAAPQSSPAQPTPRLFDLLAGSLASTSPTAPPAVNQEPGAHDILPIAPEAAVHDVLPNDGYDVPFLLGPIGR